MLFYVCFLRKECKMTDSLLLVAVILGGLVAGVFTASMAEHLMCKDVKIISRYTLLVTISNLGLWLLLLLLGERSYIVALCFPVSSALLCLSVIDGFTFEIPPQINLFIAAIGLLRLIVDRNQWYEYLIGAVCVSGLFLIAALLTKGKGMGGGDIKLMAALGFFLGWKKILLVMVIGCILGAIIHSIIMAVSKKERMLAFGPYLSAAGVIVMIWGNRLIDMYVSYIIPKP